MDPTEQRYTAAEHQAAGPGRLLLLLSSVLTVAFLSRFQLRLEVVRGVDVYYHLAVAREMLNSGPLERFPWTPYSLFAERFADKELLFHALLMPLTQLDLVSAGQLGALLGQLAVVAALAGVLWSWRSPLAPLLVLGLCSVGPPLAVRLSMCRPHSFTIAFSILALGLLCSRQSRLAALFLVAGAHGLFHSGGWLTVGFAALYCMTSLLNLPGQPRQLQLQPLGAALGGWLTGQLLHPNLPLNFEVLWLQNVTVPLGASAAGETALSAALGGELMPSTLPEVLSNLPGLLVLGATATALATRPQLRSRATITTATAALIFTLLAITLMRRMWELSGPLSLLALGATLVQAAQFRDKVFHTGRALLALAGLALLLGAANTHRLANQWISEEAPPELMARWLAKNGTPGDLVYTAQWGDSAPLLWFAPQLRSLVALDPTFLFAADPALFSAYAATITGADPDPISTIKSRFQARFVTIWKVPPFASLSTAARQDPRAQLVFEDQHYEVFELSGP